MGLPLDQFVWLAPFMWPAIVLLFLCCAAAALLAPREFRLHVDAGWARRDDSPRHGVRAYLLPATALLAAAFLFQASAGEVLAVRLSAVLIGALVAWLSIDWAWKQLRDAALLRASLHRDWMLRRWSARDELARLFTGEEIHSAACRLMQTGLGCSRVLLYMRRGETFQPAGAAPGPARGTTVWDDTSPWLAELSTGSRFRALPLAGETRRTPRRPGTSLRLSPQELELLRDVDARLAVPVQNKLRLDGFFLLGALQSGEAYQPHHLAFAEGVVFEMSRALAAAPHARAAAHRAAEQAISGVRQTAVLSARGFLSPPEAPDLPDLDFHGEYWPGNCAGGVLYDVLTLPGRSAVFVAAEIAGPPEAAAVRLVQLQTLVRTRARAYQEDLAELAASTRRALSLPDPSLAPLSLFCARYTAGDRRLHYVNAGLFPPVLFRRTLEGAHVLRLRETGPPLATQSSLRAEEVEIGFAPGDLLLITSSSVPAAANAQGQPWGEMRLIESLLDWKPGPAAAIVRNVTGALAAFAPVEPRQPARVFLLLRPKA